MFLESKGRTAKGKRGGWAEEWPLLVRPLPRGARPLAPQPPQDAADASRCLRAPSSSRGWLAGPLRPPPSLSGCLSGDMSFSNEHQRVSRLHSHKAWKNTCDNGILSASSFGWIPRGLEKPRGERQGPPSSKGGGRVLEPHAAHTECVTPCKGTEDQVGRAQKGGQRSSAAHGGQEPCRSPGTDPCAVGVNCDFPKAVLKS